MPKYFAIMLKWKGELLCSNLCQHNVPRPGYMAVVPRASIRDDSG